MDAYALAPIAGSLAGSGLASIAGGSGGGGQPTPMDMYNQILNQALQKAIQNSTSYTNQAIGQQSQSLADANKLTTDASKEAQRQLLQTTGQGFNLGQGLLSPYRNAGYAANDAYLQSLGLAPTGGANAANQGALNQSVGLLNQQFGGTAPVNPTAVDPEAIKASITQQQVQDYINQNTKAVNLRNNQVVNGAPGQNGGFAGVQYTGAFAPNGSLLAYNANGGLQGILGNKEITGQVQSMLQQQAIDKANADYEKGLTTYNDYQNQLSQIQQLYPVTSGTSQGSGQSPATTGLGNFLNSAGYQSLFGTGAADTYASTGQYDPRTAFENDPGTKFQIEQGMKALQQHGAAKGILESGGMQQNLLQFAQGTAATNYNQYEGQLANAFQQYQTQLAQMTALGSGLTGANTAASMYGNAAQLQNQNIYGTGQQQSNATLETGSNISGLLGNQGVLNANAILNTGSAQAAGLMQMLGMRAQQQNAAMASNAQTQSALANSNAGMQASGMFGYNSGGVMGSQGAGTTNYYPNGISTYTGTVGLPNPNTNQVNIMGGRF